MDLKYLVDGLKAKLNVKILLRSFLYPPNILLPFLWKNTEEDQNLPSTYFSVNGGIGIKDIVHF